ETAVKYVLIIGDGMGDWPIAELNNQTPLMAAETPNLDYMAKNGLLGLAHTVPPGMPPGSDVAIMSLMGYNPQGVLTGRGPLEAASQNIITDPDEYVFRLNLVTISHDGQVTMRDHSAGNISTVEAAPLLDDLRQKLPLKFGQKIFQGVGYRHLLTWPKLAPANIPSSPPHDYLDQSLNALLDDPKAKPIMDLVRASWEILENHPINQKRKVQGLALANSIWLWGQGVRPEIKTYEQRWGLTGSTVSAVDLIKGLGLITGLTSIEVPGATGWLDTNYEGKVEAALKVLEQSDFVVLHIEAPDEASHHGDLEAKLRAIHDFDAKVVGPMLRALPSFGDYRLVTACDHYTPLKIKTHTNDPVPFIFYTNAPSKDFSPSGLTYNEDNAKLTGLIVNPGANLGQLLFGPEKT
ncbi:MAG: cofactor-independent phosphoglycerate mutase, partial [Candidatus Adiutrix sp.]